MAVKGNLDKLIKKLEKKNQGIETANFVQKVAILLNSAIQRRVQSSGRGVYSALKEYEEKYANFRKSRGRQVAYKDLTFSGKMFASLTTEKVGRKVRMFFGSAAEAKKAYKNQKRQKFFGLTESEKTIMRNEFSKFGKM